VAVVVKKVVKKKRLTRLEVEIIDSDWWWPRCGCDGWMGWDVSVDGAISCLLCGAAWMWKKP